jgi:WD40 repeat protein
MPDSSTHIPQSSGTQQTPYVGPRPFTRADQDIFFGRNQEAIELTSLVKAHPELLLYAQSGAGKTSLLSAQVIPILDTEEEFDVLPTARVRSQESPAIPDNNIKNIYMFNAFKDLSDDKLSLIERGQLTLAEYLERQPRPPVKPAKSLEGSAIEENQELRLPRVIIFDQFEEIFTLYPERYQDRQDFFAQVSAALVADPFLRVIFSMREDYIAEVDPYVEILPQNLRTRFRLERLRKANALSAVGQPLETARVKGRRQFAPGAAELLVDRLMLIKVKTASGEKVEVPGEFVDPVQLQVVCQTLWEKLPPEETTITSEHLDKYANVDQALSVFYESSVGNAVTAANKEIQARAAQAAKSSEELPITEGAVRGWFEQKLITREGKRNMVFREGEMTAGLSNLVVDELENQHVIRVEMRGGEPWYELSHDRFVSPIRESNRRFLLQQPLAQRKAQELEARADEWLKSKRSDSLLLNRGELQDAQAWMDTEAAAIGFSETLFSLVRASEAAIEHEDSKQQQMLAEAQQQRMIAEQQRSRQMKLGLVVASLLLVVALGSAVFAFRAEGKATKALGEATQAQKKESEQRQHAVDAAGLACFERDKAEAAAKKEKTAAHDLAIAKENESAARRKAEEARKRAEADRVLAVSARKAAELAEGQTKVALNDTIEANQRAWSFKLAADSNSQLSIDPELGLRLAIEAVKFSETPSAKYSLRQAYLNSTSRAILRGHTDSVWQAAYSPKGQFIFTASEDGTLKMWDAKTNRELKTLDGQEEGVHALAISADEAHIVTEANARGRLWNLSGGTSIVLDDLTGPVATIAFSPNGKLIATEATSDSKDRKKAGAAPRIWDVDAKAIRQTLLGHELAVSALAFSPKSDLLVTASWDKTARIWDVATGRTLRVLSGHTAPLDGVAFDPSGRLVVTGSYDGTARVWEVATGKERIVLKGHTGGVRAVAFSPDGALILTVGQRVTRRTPNGNSIPLPPGMLTDEAACGDNTVRIWDAQNGTQLTIITEPTSEATSATFSAGSKLLATASQEGTVRVWEALSGTKIAEFTGHKGAVNSVAFSPDGRSVVTAGEDHTAQVWVVTNSAGASRRLNQTPMGPIQRVQFNTNGEKIVSASSNGSVSFWTSSGQFKSWGLKPDSGSELVYDSAISPNYKFAVTASRRPPRTRAISRVLDLDAHVWNLETHKSVQDLKEESRVTKVEYSPKGTYVLTASTNGTAHLWRTSETSDWTKVRELKPSEVKGDEDPGSILAAAFDPDEKYVVTAQSTGNVLVWDVFTGKNIRTIKAHDKGVTSVAFNATGDRLVTTSSDATARVWTIEGKNISTLGGHLGEVLSAEFNRDGDFIVTSGIDGTIRLWHGRTQTAALKALADAKSDFLAFDPVTAVKINENRILRASFSPDGKSIVLGDAEGFLYVFDCGVCRPFDEIKRLASELKPRELTPDEWEHFVPDKPKAILR